MEVIGTIGEVAGTISATVKLVKVIHETLGKVQQSATDEIQATNEVVQGPYDEDSGDMDGLEDSDDVNFQFLQNLHYHHGYPQRPPTTATPPIYINTGTFTAAPPCYDLSNASPYDDIVEPSPHYTFAAAAATASSYNSNASTATSRPYANNSMSSEYYTYETASISDYTTINQDSISVTWTDKHLQSKFGTSLIPERFLVKQRDGVFRTRCKISIGCRGIVPKGAECTSYAASTVDTVIVTWIDKRLQERIGPYDIPERYLARLRDGVFRTTTKLTIKDRGNVPKGAICKLLYS